MFKKTVKLPFTLLEITLCLLLLGLISALLTWQIKDMVSVHRFQKHIDLLLTDMRNAQTVALTYQTDLAIDIFKKKGQFFYKISTDEPIKNTPFRKEKKLEGVSDFMFNDQVMDKFHLQVLSNGRIEPLGIMGFLPKEKKSEEDQSESFEGLWVDLRTPIQIKLLQQIW